MKKDKDCLWTPHPKQAQALKRNEFEILYGGARGGGKTDSGINWLLYDVDNPLLRALIIRRNADDLRDWVDRANLIYYQLGAKKVGNPPEFHWPSGAVFRTGHLKDEQAYTKYMGHEYQRMLIEELNQIPYEESYLRLIGSCRSTVKGLKPQVFATTNPGSVGHAWVKKRFVDPVPPGETNLKKDRIFIQSTIDDNPSLMNADPNYVKRVLDPLKETDPVLYRAWRFGDWDVFAGQVFREFRRDKHVIKRIVPRSDMPHFLSFDWGYRDPFAAHAHAVIKMSAGGDKFNRVVTYQEWYGTEKEPHKWADTIYSNAECRKFRKGYADPSMFNVKTDGSVSIAEEMMKRFRLLNKRHWITIDKGSRNRIQRVATTHNWLSQAPDGLPYWLITENCINLIRTLPMLVYNEAAGKAKEDVDSTMEDHCWDSVSYFLSMVKFIGQVGSFGAKDLRLSSIIKRFKVGKPTRVKESLNLDLFARKERKLRDWRAI